MPYTVNGPSAEYAPNSAVIKGALEPADVAALNQTDAARVVLNGAHGWNGEGLGNLEQLTSLTHLDILPYSLTDVGCVSKLVNLQALHIGGLAKGTIDFESLIALELFSMGVSERNLKLSGIGNSPSLAFANGNFSEPSLREITGLKTLKQLGVALTRFESLQWLDSGSQLEHLHLTRCTALTDLNAIGRAEKLHTLKLTTCKKIADIAPIAALVNLSHFMFDDCGEVTSLVPLRGHRNLRLLSFAGTNIRDGVISVLETLPRLGYVRFIDRPQYDRPSSSFAAEHARLTGVFQSVRI